MDFLEKLAISTKLWHRYVKDFRIKSLKLAVVIFGKKAHCTWHCIRIESYDLLSYKILATIQNLPLSVTTTPKITYTGLVTLISLLEES
jgi:hypothetical protein